MEIGTEKILCGCYYRTGDSDVNYCKEIVKSISTEKKLEESKKYTGLIIRGDFNFLKIEWNDELTEFNLVESYVPANLFLDFLHDNFLVQNKERNKDPKLIYNKGNFLDFSLFLNKINWELTFSNLHIDECYEIFLKIYNEGCRRFIPTKILNKHNSTNSAWMTRDLKRLIKDKKVAWFKFRNAILTEKYKSLNNQVRCSHP
jgi:hypothetical protein